MSKRERVLAALRGERVDRPPVSFWFHLGTEEDPPDVVAAAEIELLETFDLDWLKVMHDYPFGDGSAIRPIAAASELGRMRRVGADEGGFAKQAEVLQRIADGVGSDVLFIETIFSPWSIAKMLCRVPLIQCAREDGAALREGLQIIAWSLSGHLHSALSCGASGIFYVINAADAATREYQDAVGDLDRELLALAQGAPFNVLHAHGEGISLAPFITYPAQALSFGIGPGQPAIAEAHASYAGALVTGIDDLRTLRTAGADGIREQIHGALRAAEPRGLLLAPGCAVAQGVTEPSLHAVRAAADSYRSP